MSITKLTEFERLITCEEIANFFTVTDTTVIDWIKAGLLKGIRINRTYRVTYEEFNEFISRHTTEQTVS
jgi:excisionase family DNA binding protein